MTQNLAPTYGATSQTYCEGLVQALRDAGLFENIDQEFSETLRNITNLLHFKYRTITDFNGDRVLYIQVATGDLRSWVKTARGLPIKSKSLIGIYICKNNVYKHLLIVKDRNSYERQIVSADGCVIFDVCVRSPHRGVQPRIE